MRSFRSLTLGFGIFAFCLGSWPNLMAQEAASRQSNSGTQAAELPDSAGTTWARLQQTSEQSGAQAGTANSSEPAQNGSIQEQSPTQDQEQNNQDQNKKFQRPVGTAAAEAPKVSGVTAAQPSGIAIAPAKQRRVRILVLKVGAIVAASAAIGTVVALSTATPSKPPGAH